MAQQLESLPSRRQLTQRLDLDFDIEAELDLAITNQDAYTIALIYQYIYIQIPQEGLAILEAEQHAFLTSIQNNNLNKVAQYLSKVTMNFQYISMTEGFHEAIKLNNLTVLSMLFEAYPDIDEILELANQYQNYDVLDLYQGYKKDIEE